MASDPEEEEDVEATEELNEDPSDPQKKVAQFQKYDKMGSQSGRVGAAATTAESNQYVVTEKVHGANFCIIASFVDLDSGSTQVRFARRTAIIGEAENAEDFFSARSAGLLRTLAPQAERVLAAAAAACSKKTVVAVHIYGELFGGSYPHPDIKPLDGLRAIQKGVWYSPGIEFIGFDLCLETDDGTRQFQDFHVARKLCEESGLMFALPLFEGTLAACLDFEYEFETTIPARLGLPQIPPNGSANLAEGVVVRPRREPAVIRASSGKESSRGLFKRKIEAFTEKKYQNNDWKSGKAGGNGTAPSGPSKEEAALIEVLACVTESRLAAVLSKIGRVDPADKAALASLLQAFEVDVQEDLAAEDLAELQANTRLQEQLRQASKDLINQEFKKSALAAKAAAAVKA